LVMGLYISILPDRHCDADGEEIARGREDF
jgi:hypothetical protein